MDKMKVELCFDSEAGIPDAIATLRVVGCRTELPVRINLVGEGSLPLPEEVLEEVKLQLAVEGVYEVTKIKMGVGTWKGIAH